MPSEPSKPSTSGIVTDEQSGERHIPESMRADGTTRKAIKIRPGYRPPEDVEIYKNRTAETFRSRGSKGGVVGAEGLKEQKQDTSASAASNKNAKRREARKKAKSTNPSQDAADNKPEDASANKTEEVDPEIEKEKKARNLKKKLKQAKELKSKKEGGESLLPEQIAKVIKINELVRELEALGFDADGEPKSNTADASKSDDSPEAAKEG
ncbi:hypothetical protein GGS26DRAFT_333505 [Hypomontagnella submonticulosa]|nr:hypothetical protein GGS26DRAFT_333505 [Hypomontagnella submonticulosa]